MTFHIPYEILTIIVQNCDPSVLFALTQVSTTFRRVVYENLPPNDRIPTDLAIHLLCHQKPKQDKDIASNSDVSLEYKRRSCDSNANMHVHDGYSHRTPDNITQSLASNKRASKPTKSLSDNKIFAPPFNLVDINFAYFHSEKTTRFITNMGGWMVGGRKGAPDEVHALRCYVAYRAYRVEEDKRIKKVSDAAKREDLWRREQVEADERALRDGRAPTIIFGARAQESLDHAEDCQEAAQFEAAEGEEDGSLTIIWEQPDI